MRKRFSQNETGLYTSAEAIAFIGCAVKENLMKEEEWAYSALIFIKNEPRIMVRNMTKSAPYRDISALYDAVEMVLNYCKRQAISSVDIIYDSDENLVSSWNDISADTPWTCLADGKMVELKEQYGTMDVQLYRMDGQELSRQRLIAALRWNMEVYWIRQLEPVDIFLALVEELATAAMEGTSFAEDVKSCIHAAACVKKIKVSPAQKPPAKEGDVKRDGTHEDTIELAGQRGDAMEKTVLDLIIEYAKSIKKREMTSTHLLYGYACICVMEVKEICEELGLGKESYEKVSYVKNKIKGIFQVEQVAMDPQKLKLLIPQYIDNFEKDANSIRDYESAMKIIENWRDSYDFSDDVIAYSVLYRMLTDTKDFDTVGLNNMYLKRNKDFSLEKKDAKESEKHINSLEAIARKSNQLYDVLTEKIYGQDFAIQKFVQGYINSKLAGQSKKDKPAASFLFAGPPGVGKTYLARTSADVIGMPIKILDMSEYADEYSSNGLVGFEKTWKGAVAGVLTSYVDENPRSIILVDEIEKAHISAQLLFLQILEGARLFDKYYEKYVSFENTIIIFTTNCGKNLYQYNEDADLSAMSESEVLESLREDEAFPNELCSRFAAGNIIVFNHLQPYYLCDIVRNKMDEVIGDISSNYQVKMTYNNWFPELFLFQAGSGIDARIASSQSAEMIKDCVMSYVKDSVEKQERLAVDRIAIDIKLDKENKDVYQLFVNESDSNILVVSDSPKLRFEHPHIHVMVAEDENEMVRIIRENKISLVLIDLTYKAVDNHAKLANALGIESVGRTCFEVIREKAPQLPVYIINQESYHAEDKKAILNYGARGLFVEGGNIKQSLVNVRKLIEQLHIQMNLKRLGQKGQRIAYRTRYLTNEEGGVIEFYNLALKAIEMDDAELRRKARKSKVFDFERPKIRFEDIIGAEQAKRDFKHFINYIHNIDEYVLEGAEIPKGILLYGPPGTGKTSLAKALAGECDALFLNTTGANIRNSENPVQEIKDLFQIAYTNAPAILFIDEIDVIAKERKGYDTGTEVLVNTLLTEMEGFSDKDPFKPVFVVAATNYNVAHRADRPSEIVIDPALVRRFDNPVYVGLPNREERKQYIQILLEKKKYEKKISEVAIDYVAEHTGGKSLAFLKRAIANMTNVAIDANKEVNDDLLTDTLETQLYGEKQDNDEAYRLSVARHEAGHAYVSWRNKREPKFITIVSRGQFGGYVSYGDGEDIRNLTKEDFLNYICQALAGRAAEMVYYDENGINTGACSDLEKATNYAIKMICYFGMGTMGLLSMDPEHILDSPKGAEVLEEANRILKEQMDRAISYIKEGRQTIDRVVEVLMDKYYIQGENLTAILEEGEQLPASSQDAAPKKQKWYVVINGRKPGIYTTWAECAKQVKGYGNAVYRSYETEEDAKEAFQSSRIGVRNVRDKKLLYHLVKLSDMEQIIQNGLLPDKQIAGKEYVGFDFHAYAPEALETQRMNSEDIYVYICISREYASRQGYQILMESSQDDSVSVYDYDEGISKIDWKEMERLEAGSTPHILVWCVTEERLSYDEFQYIYTPDEDSAALIRKLYQSITGLAEADVVVSVNKRMFIYQKISEFGDGNERISE